MSQIVKSVAPKISQVTAKKTTPIKQASTFAKPLAVQTPLKQVTGLRSTVLPATKQMTTSVPARNTLQNAATTLSSLKNPVLPSAKASPISSNPSLTSPQGMLQAISAALSIARQNNALSNPAGPAQLASMLNPVTQATANSMGSGKPALPFYSQLGSPMMDPNMMVAGPGAPFGVPAGGITKDNPDWEIYLAKLTKAQQLLARALGRIPEGWINPTSTGLGSDSDWQLKPENQ